MTAKELIALLATLPPDLPVVGFDADQGPGPYEVSEAIIGEISPDGILSDDPHWGLYHRPHIRIA